METNTILLIAIPGIPIALLLICILVSYIHKQRIKNLIIPGVKFEFYGDKGSDNPFTSAKTTLTIAATKFGFVKYNYFWEPNKQIGITELDKTKSCSIAEFVKFIYSLKNYDVDTSNITK